MDYTNAPAEIRDLDRSCRRHETPCGDGSLVWRVWGVGPPLLLLHGSHGCWTHWVRNICAMAQAREVWVPDMPGYGESAPPPDLDSPPSHAQPLSKGLRWLRNDDSPVDVVGFSLGALIGAHLAVFDADLVQRLVIVDAGGLGTPMPMAHLNLRSLRGLHGDEAVAARRHNLLTMMIHDPAAVDDQALWIDECSPTPRTHVHHQVIPDRLVEVLHKVPVQFDAIWGEYDRPHPDPEVNVAVLRDLQPGAQLRTIPRAGHWSMYEGAEHFNRALRELLEMPLRQP
ncbi:alpha/beta fold hydrolase [Mycolicibacterium sp. XJ1819]